MTLAIVAALVIVALAKGKATASVPKTSDGPSYNGISLAQKPPPSQNLHALAPITAAYGTNTAVQAHPQSINTQAGTVAPSGQIVKPGPRPVGPTYAPMQSAHPGPAAIQAPPGFAPQIPAPPAPAPIGYSHTIIELHAPGSGTPVPLARYT